MRVLGSAPASPGHLRPLLPLLAAARAAGHDVVAVLPGGDAADAARALDLHVVEVPPPDAALAAEMAQVGQRTVAMMAEDREAADLHYVRESFGRTRTAHVLPTLRTAAADLAPDVLVHDPFCGASAVVALERDLPAWRTLWSLRRPLAGVLPVLAAGIVECGAAGDVTAEAVLARLAAGPAFSPLPASFDVDDADDTGPVQRWRITEPRAQPNGDVATTDAADQRPLVYATLGTVVGQIPPLARRFVAAVFGAMAELEVQCVLTVGRDTDTSMFGPAPDNVRVETFVPHGPLLADAVACVSHGGVNTLLDAMAAGVPQVVLPMHSADGHWNAARLVDLGAGAALSGPALTPTRLAAAVTAVVTDPDTRRTVDALAADVAALPAPIDAIAALTD